MPRFFIRRQQIEEYEGQKTVVISGDDAHHISRSLRMAVGEKIEVCDMQKTVYSCALSKITDTTVYAAVESEAQSDTEPKHYIKLYQALSKGDKMETIIQKSVECGACEIIPFSSLVDINGGHGGGDGAIVEEVYNVFALGKKATTTLEESLESHIMALKAEEDRLKHQ